MTFINFAPATRALCKDILTGPWRSAAGGLQA